MLYKYWYVPTMPRHLLTKPKIAGLKEVDDQLCDENQSLTLGRERCRRHHGWLLAWFETRCLGSHYFAMNSFEANRTITAEVFLDSVFNQLNEIIGISAGSFVGAKTISDFEGTESTNCHAKIVESLDETELIKEANCSYLVLAQVSKVTVFTRAEW